MSAFVDSQALFTQYHFTVIEIDLPVVEGVCTISGSDGFGTPLTCDQASNATQTIKFTTSNAPPLDESGILRIVDSINEVPAKLKPQSGLAARGSGSISLVDVKGDPNPFAPAVSDEVREGGTFLAKLNSRNILTNRPLRIKNYRVEADGSIDLANGAEVRHYIIESFNNMGGDKWTFRFKDELSRVNIDETVFPESTEAFLTSDINSSTVTIPVNDGTLFAVANTIRIGDELMKISSISSNNLTVGARGSDIVYTNTLSKTESSEHDTDDEVFICDVADDEDIDLFLARVLVAVGIDASFIPTADWAAEIAEWHPLDSVDTLWIESLDTTDVLDQVLGDFLLDMWFDPVAREIKLTAISQWRSTDSIATEGIEIDYKTVTRKKEEILRYTRALVVFDKRFLAQTDSVENFKKASLFKRTDLEVADKFGEAKTKRFPFSTLLTKNSANLLTNRYVTRYIDPHSYKWKTQERKLNFDVGDIVNVVVDADVGFSGISSGGSRAQIMSITPKYLSIGREYLVTALSYAPILTDGEILIQGNLFNLNLHVFVGAPTAAVTMIFIFDGGSIGSTDPNVPAIVAGAFNPASKLTFILVGGADLQSIGGKGGRGQSLVIEPPDVILGQAEDGGPGGTVYDAQGIDTDIHFEGDTSAISPSFPSADGFIRAPGGGDGGFNTSVTSTVTGDGGGGGSGINGGPGGDPGQNFGAGASLGQSGPDGDSDGPFGVLGTGNDALGGPAGKGVVDSGATVVFFGDTALRYINGGGDH